MLSKTIIAFACTAASVLAAPLQARNGTVVPSSRPSGDAIYPSSTYHYDVSTGAITCNVDGGLIDKYPSNGGHDITTLLTFTYPEEARGRKCQFQFYLSNSAAISGSKKIDVFTTLTPAPGCTTTWGPGNHRDINLGRLSAQLGAFATWDATYGAYLTKPTDCKAPGTKEGFELVGVYDTDHISWGPDGSGARITFV